MTRSNWKNHSEASGGRFNKKVFQPDEESEGLIFEGEFEEITQENQSERKSKAEFENPTERRRHKNRRVNIARPLFETRAGDRRKSERGLDTYV